MTAPIVFYRDSLLSYSETFIRSQGEELQRFTPYYVGSRLTEGLSLPHDRTLVVNRGRTAGKTREMLYKLLGIAPGLYRGVRSLSPVLVHAHFGPDGVSALPLARDLRIPLVVTFYGFDATMKDEYVRHSFHKQYRYAVYLRHRETLKREARLFIGVSEYIRDRLLEQGFPPEKTVAHYYGVDTQAFRPDPAVAREPVVLFVGRLVEKKGCEYLIRAMARVQARMPDARLVIAGDGPLRPGLEALAKSLLPRYEFLGRQTPEEVRGWMNRSRLLAAPSVTASTGDSEGLPTAVVEAQAMGLPVVGSLHAGIPQAITHEKTGLLAPERDWERLAEHILRLLEDEALWERFSVRGQERVRSDFDLRRQTRVLEAMYRTILQGEL